MLTQKRTFGFIGGALALLLVPFFAMLFQVEGWDWKLPDFLIIGVLLVGVGVGAATATNRNIPLSHRLIGAAAVGFLFLLYVHLAVGIVDTWPLAGS